MPSYYQKPKLTVCQRISNFIKWFSSLFGTNIHTYIGQEFFNSRDVPENRIGASTRTIFLMAACSWSSSWSSDVETGAEYAAWWGFFLAVLGKY